MLTLYGFRKASLVYLSFNDSQLYQNMHLIGRNFVSNALQVMRVAILVAVIVKNLFLMFRKTNKTVAFNQQKYPICDSFLK